MGPLRVLDRLLDPANRPGLEATEHFMSWLRFAISALGAGAYLLSLPYFAPVSIGVQVLIAVAFLYSIPHIFIRPGQATRWTRARILFNTVLDFVLATAAVAMTGGINSGLTWLFPLTIVGNVLRYGDNAGALTTAGSMIVFAGVAIWQGAPPNTVVASVVSRIVFYLVLYFMAAHLSRYAVRMERVARKGSQLMEAIGRIGVPVNLAGNVSLALTAVCQEIRVLFDVDHVFIWLVDGAELFGAAATSESKEILGTRRPLDDSDVFGARVIRGGRPLLMNGVPAAGDGLDAKIARAHDLKAVIGIPLVHGNAAVGVMILADSRNPHRFREEDLAPAMLLGNLAATALYHASMHDQLRQAYARTLETLGEAIDVHDAYTGGHSQRIARYADEIARELNCPPEMHDQIRTAAMLHDVGKIGVPDSVLLKPGGLSSTEMEIMKSHSLIGARLLRTAGFADEVVTCVRHLHERYDGSGYPAALKGDEIPLGSRILAVADTYEAMTSDRIYRSALKPADALFELRRFSGTQFDPVIVETFARVEGSLHMGPPAGETSSTASVDDVFSVVMGRVVERFREFAGSQVTDGLLAGAAAECARKRWALRAVDGRYDIQTPERQSALEARRHILTWVFARIEQLGGRRIALHLLADVIENLTPAAQETYRLLLAPGEGTDKPKATAPDD